jgi:hypothetical protein
VEAWAEGMNMAKIAFRIHDQSLNGPISPVCRIDSESGALAQGSSVTELPGTDSPDTTYIPLVACPTNATTMNISLGIANGPWETAITLEHQKTALGSGGANGEGSASYNAIQGSSGEVAAINFNYDRKEDWETRMVSVDDNDHITVVPENSQRTSPLETGGILLVSSNEFAHIKEFQLQRRKYQWVEFRNVALKPGYRTTVAVKDSDEQSQSATPAPASPIVVDLGSTNYSNSATGTPPLSTDLNSREVTNDNAVYAPVIERTLPFDKRGLTESLDLDSGKIISPLPDGTVVTADSYTIPGFPQAAPGGISFSRDAKILLATGDTDINAVAPGNWDAMLPSQLPAELDRSQFTPGVSIIESSTIDPAELPKTFVFKTRQGSIGLLQVIGLTANASGVKFRYKLVLNGQPRKASPDSASDSPDHGGGERF